MAFTIANPRRNVRSRKPGICWIPIVDDDVTLIAFNKEGKVIPNTDLSDWQWERVREILKRWKCNKHVPLAEARRQVWQNVDALVDGLCGSESALQ